RWSGENDGVCAAAGRASERANRAPAKGRRSKVMVGFLVSSLPPDGASLGFVARNVVGFHPSRRADRKTRLGAGGKLARGAKISAHEGSLRRGEIGTSEIALVAIGHRKLGIGLG